MYHGKGGREEMRGKKRKGERKRMRERGKETDRQNDTAGFEGDRGEVHKPRKLQSPWRVDPP